MKRFVPGYLREPGQRERASLPPDARVWVNGTYVVIERSTVDEEASDDPDEAAEGAALLRCARELDEVVRAIE